MSRRSYCSLANLDWSEFELVGKELLLGVDFFPKPLKTEQDASRLAIWSKMARALPTVPSLASGLFMVSYSNLLKHAPTVDFLKDKPQGSNSWDLGSNMWNQLSTANIGKLMINRVKNTISSVVVTGLMATTIFAGDLVITG